MGANPDQNEWRPNPRVEHIELARWADVVAVAPATANMLGQAANGLAGDLLATLLLATKAPILWAPAMNAAMWEHPAVQANFERLKSFGHKMIEPSMGMLACGEEGAGKLADIEDIADAIRAVGSERLPSLTGKKVLVTAGPTREDLDPVRLLTNRSTGEMGIEIARALRDAGAEVHLVVGGDLAAPYGIETARVRTAEAMMAACSALWPGMDGCIAAAAVADQRPQEIALEKVKKGDGPENLVLVRTQDILLNLGMQKRVGQKGQWLVGFAAESEHHLENASAKLAKKKLDAVFVNDISTGKAFGHQDNTLTPVIAEGPQAPLGPLPKGQLAQALVVWWAEWLGSKYRASDEH
ncbi:MAG: bifunctional phosphopantothenoylcysteine decarboxylase/phosphopantothenate--cysteine ligase CoaBC [Holophagaceae bacterium]|nr:bifunctional phosphopantothenoylcysteine decarboxylase/phosphopantothenate--cysteine ligase CoaBC [Holophagaceae bacterium]